MYVVAILNFCCFCQLMIEWHLPGASVGGMVFVFSIVDISVAVVVVVVVVVVEVTGFAFLHLSNNVKKSSLWQNIAINYNIQHWNNKDCHSNNGAVQMNKKCRWTKAKSKNYESEKVNLQ